LYTGWFDMRFGLLLVGLAMLPLLPKFYSAC
jgi:hypothetical protein